LQKIPRHGFYRDARRRLHDSSAAFRHSRKLLADNKLAEAVISDQTVTGKLKSSEDGKSMVVANIVAPSLA
jgi:hypothetical protein